MVRKGTELAKIAKVIIIVRLVIRMVRIILRMVIMMVMRGSIMARIDYYKFGHLES